MKTLRDFPSKADPNKNPLHVVYSEVTFSELKTFDLMRLLNSFRKFNRDLFQYPAHYIGSKEYISEHIESHKGLYKTREHKAKARAILINWDWSEQKQSHRNRMKYYQALKKELATRNHLTKHEKRSIYKRS